ncbi:MAG: hypothetical protein WHT81_02870 [Rectinemataceae bacterium]|nr:hypothetical protein [Spirochaetaceae bacterium]
MRYHKRYAALLIALAMLPLGIMAAPSPLDVSLEAELGTVKVFSHTYRVGPSPANTEFDFVTMGGQEILFPFSRLSVQMLADGRHSIRFLYQPLELTTQTVARTAFTIDDVTFAAGSPVDIVYSFPFYRVTYLYDLLRGADFLGVGAAVQLRNASIRFSGFDAVGNDVRAVSQNLGIVPALAVAGEFGLPGGFFAGFEATGIYASSALLNGATFQFEGSILDASIRAGRRFQSGAEAFLNFRFLGGSAAGVSQYPDLFWTESQNDETANYLTTGSVTFGARIGL